MRYFFEILLFLCCISLSSLYSQTSMFTAAYFQNDRHVLSNPTNRQMLSSEIDWSAITHLIYNTVTTNANGNIQWGDLLTGAPNSKLANIVQTAHANNKPILLSIGGIANKEFADALRTTNTRTTLINQMKNAITDHSLDGWDVDFEVSWIRDPYDTTPEPNKRRYPGIQPDGYNEYGQIESGRLNDEFYYKQFITELYTAIHSIETPKSP